MWVLRFTQCQTDLVDTSLCAEDWIGTRVEVVIDRPLGSLHPSGSGLVYSLNCGFVPNTLAADDEEVDAYVLDAAEPIERCVGEVIAIIRRRDDVEDKLVVRVGDVVLSASDIEKRTRFQEQWFDSHVEMPEPRISCLKRQTGQPNRARPAAYATVVPQVSTTIKQALARD